MIRTGPYGDLFGQNPDGLSIEKLRENPHGIDLGRLSARVPQILTTPSGRIETAPSAIIQDFDRLDAMLDDSKSTQMLLVGRRDIRSNNSWMHNLKGLSSGSERCFLYINPMDAENHNLQEGETAHISSEAGELQVPIHVTEEIMPGVVSLPHGWGHRVNGTRLRIAQDHAGVNSNILTDRHSMDPLSGNAVLNGIPISIDSIEPG
jgi:anaerobic selenocysteine-containing dehydrogenase